MSKQSKTSKESWKSRKRHTVTLWSGAVVDIEIPDLPELIKTGVFPNHLVEHAIKLQNSGKAPSVEDITEQADFYDQLVLLTVKDPELTQEDLKDLPYEDREMVVEFATRSRDFDAVGHHLGGLELVESFRDLRGL